MGLLLTACIPSFPTTTKTATPALSEDAHTPSPTPTAEASRSHTQTPLATSPEVPDKIELSGAIVRFWYASHGPEAETIRKLVEDFNLTNEWGIVVVPQAFNSLDEMSQILASPESLPDAPHIAIGFPFQAIAWDEAHPLVDLQPYVDDPLWGITAEGQQDYYLILWEQDVIDGRRLGFPFQRSGQVLYYNVSWARELGFLAPPATSGQFRQQACAAAQANRLDDNRDNDGTGGWIISTDYPAILGWIYAFDGQIHRQPEPAPGDPVYQFDSPQIESAFTFLRELYDSGCAWGAENPYPEADFANRLGLFAVGSVMGIPYQTEAFRQAARNDEWTVLPFPSDSLNPAIDVYGPSLVLFESAPREQLAGWVLIKWLASTASQARLVETAGGFPLRASALAQLSAYKERYPQWAAASELMDVARSEPPFKSWDVVRWALSDASTQLFRSYFTLDQLPLMLKFLERTANDLHIGPERSGVFDTPTNTPTATPRPTITPTFTNTPRPTRTPVPMATSTPTRTPRPTNPATPTP